jgi:hypothetical protein
MTCTEEKPQHINFTNRGYVLLSQGENNVVATSLFRRSRMHPSPTRGGWSHRYVLIMVIEDAYLPHRGKMIVSLRHDSFDRRCVPPPPGKTILTLCLDSADHECIPSPLGKMILSLCLDSADHECIPPPRWGDDPIATNHIFYEELWSRSLNNYHSCPYEGYKILSKSTRLS